LIHQLDKLGRIDGLGREVGGDNEERRRREIFNIKLRERNNLKL